ncbi:MAG: acyl-CoA thioesterase, partial [Rhodospirillales bacterium]|nr:acyl-CoA thioesterase [Rhodospirillales bacterium]
IDGQSIVFNAHYLTYFDTTITEFMRWLGYDYVGEVKETGKDFHTVKTLVEYKAPIYFDEEIEVAVKAARIGTSSLTFALAIFGRDGNDLRATGEVVWVFTDQKTRKTVPVPDKLRTLIAAKTGA